MKKEIIRKNKIIELTLNEEKIFIKKSSFLGGMINLGYKQVYPIRKELDKPIIEKPLRINWNNINWKHLITGGTWFNLIAILLIVGIILGSISEYSNAVRLANKCKDYLSIIYGFQ